MDLRSDHPYWLLRDGLLSVYPKLDRNIRCDVLVVGGGITGALTAWHLQEAGLSTVVVDRREVAWGSTAASTSLLQYEIDMPLVELTKKIGWGRASSAYLACRSAIKKLQRLVRQLDQDCGFSLRPSLYLGKSKRDTAFMQREAAARKHAGIQLEFWSSSTLKKKTGLRRPSALWSMDGAQVDAFALAHMLLNSACRKGLRVYDRSELNFYDWRKGSIQARSSTGHTIHAGRIVFATGYETQSFTPRNLVSLHSTFAMISEPFPGHANLWKKNCLIWEHANPYLYLRTTNDHRIIIGGEDEPYRDPKRRDAALPGKTKTLVRKFHRLFPRLEFEPAFSWAGTFGTTKDGLPYIGSIPEFPRAWFTLGFGGNGITYSILAAEMVRDSILGRPNPLKQLFAFDR
jgi:glycine/D-amino acid oxidase-like deaminating enzyme